MTDSSQGLISKYENRIRRERAARRAAEELLEQKSGELFEANKNLASLNESLETRVNERTTELDRERRKAIDLSERDFLTQLANRQLYAKKINRAVSQSKRGGGEIWLVLIDLDGFKFINDTYGHMAGDVVLKTIAGRIKRAVRKSDLVARLGGDEFAVILKNIDGEAEALQVANRIIEDIQVPIKHGKREMRCGASIGISYCPTHSASSDELQAFADLALYQAKATGRGVAVLFEEAMANEWRNCVTLGADLDAAILNDEIEIHFQPIVDLKTRHLAGLESLLRWQHPKHGWISPLDILDVARDRNMLGNLTRKIIELTLAETSKVLNSSDSIWVSINLSDCELRDQELPQFILNNCNKFSIDPSKIKLEVTEHTMIGDPENTSRMMNFLHKHGIKFAIDDFGTGYSNLLTLKRLPFHTLKIDQTFVSDLFENKDAHTIIKAMVDLAHSLDLKVVAEGVETLIQSSTIESLGCDFGQGYLYGRPQPMQDLKSLISIRKTDGNAQVDWNPSVVQSM